MISSNTYLINYRLITILIINLSCLSTANSTPQNPLGLEFPIRPNNLSFGVFKEYAVENPNRIPFMMFAIGNDDVSINWLQANSQFFNNSNAIGFLISSDYPHEVQEIREKTGFIKLFLMPNVDELVIQYSIPNYPFVLDTQQGLIRQ